MFDYFINKWKQKNIGNPPSNWKDILIKLLNLEHYQGGDPTDDFERFTEEFEENDDYDKEQETEPQTKRNGWFPDAKPIGLKGGLGNDRPQQVLHLKLSNNLE